MIGGAMIYRKSTGLAFAGASACKTPARLCKVPRIIKMMSMVVGGFRLQLCRKINIIKHEDGINAGTTGREVTKLLLSNDFCWHLDVKPVAKGGLFFWEFFPVFFGIFSRFLVEGRCEEGRKERVRDQKKTNRDQKKQIRIKKTNRDQKKTNLKTKGGEGRKEGRKKEWKKEWKKERKK